MEFKVRNIAPTFFITLLFLGMLAIATPVFVPRARADDPPPTATFKEWDTTARVPGIPEGGDFNPHVIQVDHTGITGYPAGSVWSVVDNPLCDLVNLDPATNVYTHWALLGGGSTEGIAVNTGNGDVWGTIVGPGVGFIPGTGFSFIAPVYVKLSGTNSFILYKSPSAVRGIAVSGDDPFFAEIAAGNIVHLTKATGAATKWAIGAVTPSYVAIASDGKVYFTETGTSKIGRLDPIALALNIREWTVPTAASGPLGIFIDPFGNVWFTESSSNRVAKLDPVGNTITEYPKAPIMSPNQIAVSSAGQAFYTDSVANTVNILTPFGNETATPVVPADRTVTPVPASYPIIKTEITPTVGVITPVVTVVPGIDPSDTVIFPVPTPMSDPVGISDVVEVTTTFPNGTTVTTNTIYFDEHFEAPGLFAFAGKIGCLTSKIIKTPPPPGGIKVSKFFTDTSFNPLPKDSKGNPKVDVVIAGGVVRSTNPGEIMAWVNVTNTDGSLQSLKLNETLPMDWVIAPPWMPALGAIHVFYANTTSLATNPEITQPSTITVSGPSPPQTVHVAIPSFNATAIGHPLLKNQSILLEVKLDYALDGTTQSASTFPRNYTDTASAKAWRGENFTGLATSGNVTGLFTAYAKVVGDVDGDGSVDITDLVQVWQHQFTSNRQFDVNGDGAVDINDLVLTWQFQFT